MYNLAFADAHRCFEHWEKIHPDDPIAPVSDAAAYLFSEFDRLHILQSEFFVDDNTFVGKARLMPDPAVKRDFDEALTRTQQLADRKLALNFRTTSQPCLQTFCGSDCVRITSPWFRSGIWILWMTLKKAEASPSA